MQLRNRLVKANFWTDTELAKKLPATGRMMYQGLWQLAEDSGCIEADPVAFKMILFPLDDISLEKIEQWTNMLLELDKLIPYQYQKKEYYYIKNFHKHQSLRSPGKPELPLPEWIEYMPNPKPYQSGGYIINYEIMPGEYEGMLTVGNVNESIEQPNNNRKDTLGKPYGYPNPTNKKEKENKNIELEEELEGNTEGEEKTAEPPVPYQDIADMYNQICGSKLSRINRISDNRKKHLQARWKEVSESIDEFKRLFEITEESKFLTGNNDRNWKADFDWLIKNNHNFNKVLEGKYSNDRASPDKDRASPEEIQVVDLVKNQLSHDITAMKARELLKYANNNIDLIKDKILEAQEKRLEPAQAYYWLENAIKKTNSLYKGYR